MLNPRAPPRAFERPRARLGYPAWSLRRRWHARIVKATCTCGPYSVNNLRAGWILLVALERDQVNGWGCGRTFCPEKPTAGLEEDLNEWDVRDFSEGVSNPRRRLFVWEYLGPREEAVFLVIQRGGSIQAYCSIYFHRFPSAPWNSRSFLARRIYWCANGKGYVS